MTATIDYEALSTSNLQIDAIYRSQRIAGDRQAHYRDPFSPLLGVRAQGGFRWPGNLGSSPYMVIYSDFVQAEWPDRIDETTGQVVYFGDNREPGRELHDVDGNRWLRDQFNNAQSGQRQAVVPTFVFTKGTEGRDAKFRGLVR